MVTDRRGFLKSTMVGALAATAAAGVTEVLAYGTAVVIEPVSR